MDLSGKIALVTGAAKRLGRSIAFALAEDGADLVLHVHTSSAEEVARGVRELGRQAVVVRADLSRTPETVRLVQEVCGKTGHIDILINSAAGFSPTPLTDLTARSWRTILATNLTAPFALALLFGRVMRMRGEGSIIQLGDWSGLRPVPGYLPYCVSKGGLQALTHSLAKAFAPQVRVNSVALGPVLVPDHFDAEARTVLARRTPLGRLGSPGDAVRVLRFLLGKGGFITGATYFVDGGWLARTPNGTGTSL